VPQATRILAATASDPKTPTEASAWCLENLSYIAQDDGDAMNALKYGKLALERLRSAPHPPLTTEALYLGSIAYAQSLNGDNDAAGSTYATSMDEFVRAGSDRSPEAVSVRNNWAIVSIVSGNPRRAVALLDQTLEILGSNDPQSLAPNYLLGNRAHALYLLGRFDEARNAYVKCAAQAEKVSGVASHSFCLLGLVGIWKELGNLTAAKDALEQASAVIPESVPANAPPRLALEFRRGQLALAESRFADARAHLDAAVAGTRTPQTLIYPLLSPCAAESRGPSAPGRRIRCASRAGECPANPGAGALLLPHRQCLARARARPSCWRSERRSPQGRGDRRRPVGQHRRRRSPVTPGGAPSHHCAGRSITIADWDASFN
jgi:tetratricopeptide (TPR) repeat protein